MKFDGWRIQLHKRERNVDIYTERGSRCAHKLELIAAAATHLPQGHGIIDGEFTASDVPNFYALHFHNGCTERCIWAFDLIYLDGKDLRGEALSERKHCFEKLILKVRARANVFAKTSGNSLLTQCSAYIQCARVGRRQPPIQHGLALATALMRCLSWMSTCASGRQPAFRGIFGGLAHHVAGAPFLLWIDKQVELHEHASYMSA